MPFYYFDSSALVKKYLPETGSEWTENICNDPNNVCIIADIGIIEIVATFARKKRQDIITDEKHKKASRLFLGDAVNKYEVISLNRAVKSLALELVNNHPLKAYDSVQLATCYLAKDAFAARGYDDFIFLSADNQLLRAARNEGLQTDNPNEH